MTEKITYEKSGVSIEQGDKWVDRIKTMFQKYPKANHKSNSIGGFAGLYDQGNGNYLVACTDGVGTKVELARRFERLEGLGQDLVAMCLNDMITCGAKPMFFLDYIACGKLNSDYLAPVVESIFSACSQCSTAVLGGETAEMPLVYGKDVFDLAGFAVGSVSKKNIIDLSQVTSGDCLVGLPSSGVHSNGYSLVNHIINGDDFDPQLTIAGQNIIDLLIKPTKLYVNTALQAVQNFRVKGMAHITGGGLEGNILRATNGNAVNIDYSKWERPLVFDWLQKSGVEEDELRKVFNLGIGYVFIIDKGQTNSFISFLTELGESPNIIGAVA